MAGAKLTRLARIRIHVTTGGAAISTEDGSGYSYDELTRLCVVIPILQQLIRSLNNDPDMPE